MKLDLEGPLVTDYRKIIVPETFDMVAKDR
jgi:hypothetical protein